MWLTAVVLCSEVNVRQSVHRTICPPSKMCTLEFWREWPLSCRCSAGSSVLGHAPVYRLFVLTMWWTEQSLLPSIVHVPKTNGLQELPFDIFHVKMCYNRRYHKPMPNPCFCPKKLPWYWKKGVMGQRSNKLQMCSSVKPVFFFLARSCPGLVFFWLFPLLQLLEYMWRGRWRQKRRLFLPVPVGGPLRRGRNSAWTANLQQDIFLFQLVQLYWSGCIHFSVSFHSLRLNTVNNLLDGWRRI